jgi:uncharacterized membrane protein YhaH (DUF805 family)
MKLVKILGFLALVLSLVYLPMDYCSGNACNFFAWEWIWNNPKWGEQISVFRTILQVLVATTLLVGIFIFQKKENLTKPNKNPELIHTSSHSTEIPATTIGIQDAMLLGIKKWKTFDGRASRGEFFYFFPLALLITFLLKILYLNSVELFGTVGLFVVAIVCVFPIIAILSVTVRRLQDINRSGAWSLLWFTTIGAPMLVALLCEKGRKSSEKASWTPLLESALIAATFWLSIFIFIESLADK